MKHASLGSLIRNNLARNMQNVVMSSFGIIIGISAFVFFIGLSEGIKEVVLKRIFLIEQVEVIPPRVGLLNSGLNSFFGTESGDKINDELMERFSHVTGLEGVYPKMKFTFPAFAYGGKQFLGRNVKGELIADGIDPALVRQELGETTLFRDLEAPIACQSDSVCQDGMSCVSGACKAISCAQENDVICTGMSYCDLKAQQCLRPIPILLNEQILELYNGGLAVALGKGRSLPKISKEMILGVNFTFNVELNRSAIMRSKGKKTLKRKLKIVGFSDKAMNVGVTLPIEYVKRFNARFTSAAVAKKYHSIILKIKDQTHFPEIVEAVRQQGLALAEKTSNAEQASKIIKTIEALFALISLIIVGIAAINISQMFFMIIYQRKKELGLLRALGANRMDIQKIIVGEAICIGFIGGVLGLLGGISSGALVNWIASQLPRFPYKPESFFIYPPWLWVSAVCAAIIFCIIGAYFPARTAARQEPATALTQ